MWIAAIGLGIFLFLGWKDFRESSSIGDKASLRLQYKGVAFSLFIVITSLWLVNFYLPSQVDENFRISSNRKQVLALSLLFSMMISLSWYVYMSWLDIYEKEKAGGIILTFVLSCFSTFLVFPISDLIKPITFSLNGHFFNDLMYCIVDIGMIEELVKIIPLLIILRFKRFINESYDYILYAAVCALGFAFVENTLYLRNTDLYVLNGRSMFSTVAHMFDTGIIGYFMAMAYHRKTSVMKALVIGYLLASAAHGFYDFWLISEGYQWPWMTIIFFLISIHLFTVMKNNLINISEHYDARKRLQANRNKFRLFNLLLFIMFGGYVAVFFVNGSGAAEAFLKDSLTFNSYVLVYLAVSFGSISVVKGYIAPFKFSRNFLLPLINRHPNYLGLKLEIFEYKKESSQIPLSGRLTRRLVVNDDFNWYYFAIDSGSATDLILRPVSFTNNLKDGKLHRVKVAQLSIDVHDELVTLENRDIIAQKDRYVRFVE